MTSSKKMEASMMNGLSASIIHEITEATDSSYASPDKPGANVFEALAVLGVLQVKLFATPSFANQWFTADGIQCNKEKL